MPIAFEMLRIDGEVIRLNPLRLEDEARLEMVLKGDIRFLGLDVMVIGQQVPTAFGKFIDLLAIDAQGDLIVIELKRDKTPREIVAQLLDYGSWITSLKYADITAIFSKYSREVRFEEAFAEYFGNSPPETLNVAHRLVIVASELDHSTERIVAYLSTHYSVPINAVFFRYLKDEGHEYLIRTWLIDPNQPESGTKPGPQTPEVWAGDFYVALGESKHRSWDDCMQYGFVSAGQGTRYSRALAQLSIGKRIFVHIPGSGYVGVGAVIEPSVRVKDFIVNFGGQSMSILEAPHKAADMSENSDNPELSEYLVRVEWEKKIPKEQAIWEKGMFANQNVVAKLRNKFTLDRLKEGFGLPDQLSESG